MTIVRALEAMGDRLLALVHHPATFDPAALARTLASAARPIEVRGVPYKEDLARFITENDGLD